MIDKKYFEKIQKIYDEQDKEREEIIRKSRDIIKLSKHIIYSVHRSEMREALKNLNLINKEVSVLNKLCKKCPDVDTSMYKMALQEYVEAVCFYEFVAKGKISNGDELNIDWECYLLGVCDLVGELMRKAVNSGIKHEYEKVLEVKNFVDDLYDELMKFDFRNSELRKKVDGIKWELKKIDDMMFTVKGRK